MFIVPLSTLRLNSNSLTGGYSQQWHRVVDFIPQLGTKNLASGGVGAEVGSLGHTVAPHTPPISYERTDAFEDSTQCCGSGIRYLLF